MAGQPPLGHILQKVSAGMPISAAEENIVRGLAKRYVDIPNSITDSSGVRQALPSQTEEDLVWGMIMENHPGQGVCIDIILGTWCPDEGRFRFDCDTAAADYETGIDWHYTVSAGGSIPEPDAYAQGWWKPMPFKWTKSGYIYVNVTLDCDSDGGCASHGLTDGECPEQATDPCGGA